MYDLIYKRTLASQMANAKLDKTVAKISISGREEWFVARGEVITFEGFLKLYLEGTDDEDGVDETTKDMLPAMTEGQDLTRAPLSRRNGSASTPLGTLEEVWSSDLRNWALADLPPTPPPSTSCRSEATW